MTTSGPRLDLGQTFFDEATWTNPKPLAILASTGILLGATADILFAAARWNDYLVGDAIINHHTGGLTEAIAADNLVRTAAWTQIGALLVAAILYLTWQRRAYNNATWFTGSHTQRHTRGWATGAWFCPIVNLWFPYQVMTDIWRSSPPHRPAPTTALVSTWWGAWIATTAINLAEILVFRGRGLDGIHTRAILDTLSAATMLAAAILITLVIAQITRWQTTPRNPDTPPTPLP
ncbi:DUF4328 domain-containing protein [Kibdelosporangium lantanae]|uniref:DUF4328 domain-containing protein n=1 Tax=Kibdelosporangium lantanae TaxID=1497396 RepID=A0ABW3M9M3_9PSEU